LEKYVGTLAERLTEAPSSPAAKPGHAYPAREIQRGALAFQRADLKGEASDLKKRAGVYWKIGSDTVVQKAEETSPARGGLRKSALLNSDLAAARGQFSERGIKVVAEKAYDPRDPTVLAAYRSTPSRLPRGAEVEVYTNPEGKVLFYTLRQPAAQTVTEGISESTRAELSEWERRKSALADTASLKAELSNLTSEREATRRELEALKSELSSLGSTRAEIADTQALRDEFAAMKSELAALQTARANLGNAQAWRTELGTLKQEIVALRTEREAEAARLAELENQRAIAARETGKLAEELETLLGRRRDLDRTLARERPIAEVEGLTDAQRVHLEALGVRTVGELANANPEAIVRPRVLTPTQADKLVSTAKLRLGRG
jgi:hypothetical protein